MTSINENKENQNDLKIKSIDELAKFAWNETPRIIKKHLTNVLVEISSHKELEDLPYLSDNRQELSSVFLHLLEFCENIAVIDFEAK